MSDLRQVFEAKLQEDRYDKTTRLVYADWLEEQGLDDEAVEQRRRATDAWEAADRYMHDFADKGGWHNPNYYGDGDYGDGERVTYDMVMEAARACKETGEAFVQLGSENLRDMLSEDGALEEFWRNWSILANEAPPAKVRWEWDIDDEYGDFLPRPFSCSC